MLLLLLYQFQINYKFTLTSASLKEEYFGFAKQSWAIISIKFGDKIFVQANQFVVCKLELSSLASMAHGNQEECICFCMSLSFLLLFYIVFQLLVKYIAQV